MDIAGDLFDDISTALCEWGGEGRRFAGGLPTEAWERPERKLFPEGWRDDSAFTICRQVIVRRSARMEHEVMEGGRE